MHILIKYASRSRPEKFFEGLHNIIDTAADKVNYTVFCCLDMDDLSMFEADTMFHFKDGLQQKWQEVQQKSSNIILDVRSSKSKIDAINRPLSAFVQANWEILVNFSDDMRFTVYGWDQLIREGFRCNGFDKFLHFPDSTAKNMLATMSIMDRNYFKRDGYIYDPSYKSLWCDNEALAVAKLRGCYVYMGTQIFDHYHPAYGLAQWDEQYHRQQAFWAEDELNYIYRKSHNFFLDDQTLNPYPHD
jgi:hypothetical protein